MRGDEPVGRERVEVLANRGLGQPERGGELAGRRLGPLQAVDDPPLGLAELAACSDLTPLINRQIIASVAFA